MKTKYLGLLLIGTVALGTAGFMGGSHQEKLVVHEWGTFTSLQGSDGVPLQWNPLESSHLPKFVYSWMQPGLGRSPGGLLAYGQKSALVTLQRMETPVIYFYTDKEQTVDLSVRFPKGGITEWYPQALEIGPSFVQPGSLVTSLDAGLHRCGVSPNFTLNSLFDGKNVKESVIHWSDLKVLPAARSHDPQLPKDASGSHYFAARETDSAYLQAPTASPTNPAPEFEKFLFYRGVGNFATPLSVSMTSDGIVSLVNSGQQDLSHLFVLGINGEAGNCFCLDGLKPGQRKEFGFDMDHQKRPLAALRQEIRKKMERALVSEGLYPREAKAMVNTWDDSWFQEQGLRVLYVLPRPWTDEILPMTVSPAPVQLVRVMVGRAELITPALEQHLTTELTQASQGRPEADQELKIIAKQLGRFAGPVFRQALAHTETRAEERDRLLALLNR